MGSWQLLGSISIAAVSGVAGWVMSEALHLADADAGSPVVESAARNLTDSDASPPGVGQADRAVTLFRDGTVTVNVQNRPLQWLLEEIARQGSGATLISTDHGAKVQFTGDPSAVIAQEKSPPSETIAELQAKALKSIREGDEKARYEGLLSASSGGISIPQETLKMLFETDASERVRLLAFEQYLGVVQEASIEDTRAVLQAALFSPSTAIQVEARKLLDELEESQRIDAANPQTGVQ